MYKVLTLDRGGSRGVLSVCMLKKIEQEVAKKNMVEKCSRFNRILIILRGHL